MRKLIFCSAVLLNFTLIAATHAQAPQATIVDGIEAQQMFDELLGHYEYSYGGHVYGLTIDTVVRHDNSTRKCSKEITRYGENKESIVYECVVTSL